MIFFFREVYYTSGKKLYQHTNMVSFSCEVCNDTVLKKRLSQHQGSCYGAYFTCIDCSTTFYNNDHVKHTSCISEAEKYEKALYKPKKKAQEKKAVTAVDTTKKNVSESKEVKAEKSEDKTVEKKEKKEKTGKTKEEKKNKKEQQEKEFDLSKYIDSEPTSLFKIFKNVKKTHKNLSDKNEFLKNVKLVQDKDGSIKFSL